MMHLSKMISVEKKIKVIELVNRVKGLFKNYRYYKNIRKKKIFIIGIPEYTNLGDHAIAMAQRSILDEFFADREIIEITNDMMNEHCLAIRYTLKKDDVITLIGGGNFGNEYPSEQNARMLALRYFKNNRIVMFPQTIYFTDKGQEELGKVKHTVEKCRDLHMFFREKRSYDFAKTCFPSANIHFAVDTVFCLEYDKTHARNGVLICCRNDKEVFISSELVSKIEEYFHVKGKETKKIDTVVKENVQPNERDENVNRYLDLFSKSEMVVTDRLHGMIFAAITGTPCIVFPNYNYKVRGCYETIKELSYIQIVEEPFYQNFEILMEKFPDCVGNSGYNKEIYAYKYLIRDVIAGPN